MNRAIILITAALLAVPAHAVNVLTSIKPIQMIATELTVGVTSPHLLVHANASPHDYALRPSDVKKINQADLIVWYGRDLEPFLEKILADKANTLTLSSIPQLALREFGSEHNHDHDGHEHGMHDPHFWLGIEPTLQVAHALAEELAKVDPANAQRYQVNLEKFEHQLMLTDSAIKTQLAPVRQRGYFVFHDAYGYFEDRYQMTNLGHFTVSPDRKPGAKTLIRIRKALSEEEVACVFAEPQFTPAIVDSVMRGSQAGRGTLDPLGSQLEVAPGSYFRLLHDMADSLSQCLSDE
ncbi:zinc ABC transporter substrate-binding protein ZnuA [Vibrio sp. CAU 1672]|uniref:zinc ABC transporter substrate-binding protein ZnuA n=1 Tax=Vibrio sp. CAU 1672 TaxID=3032594 RepID=UPI0023DAC45A|nr:zinc ABC transporter substrate-binding protein ZnuA [Vibrio sp. CAU 1672]MDF2155272.1 zinc ABC transporter substrate-binding protein ZnuA [Vibrio sp. CAU 1672]